MTNSLIAEQVRKLYRDRLPHLITSASVLVDSDHSTKKFVRFKPKEWSTISNLARGHGWRSSRQLVLFELQNSPDNLRLALVIGPGPDDVRKAIFTRARERADLFPACPKVLSGTFATIWSREVLARDCKSEDLEAGMKKVSEVWDEFIRYQLPALTTMVAAAAAG